MLKKRQKIFLKKLSAVLLSIAVILSTVSCGKGKTEDYSTKRLATEAFGIAENGDYVYNGEDGNT